MADPAALRQSILLLGARGMLGSALQKAFSGPGLSAYSHEEVDITDYATLEKTFRRKKPAMVLNAAAFTRVDDCEKFREAAFLTNTEAPGHLASLCRKHDSLMVHFSTDYIFDGKSSHPYDEDYAPQPVNYYGVTKWEAEKRIFSSGCSYLIVRTAWIFGKNGNNFVTKILRRALAGAKLQAPVDQYGSPTYADDVAVAVVQLIDSRSTGIVHFTSAGQCNRYEQAEVILQLYGLNNPIEAVTNESLHAPAPRPYYSVMSTIRYAGLTGHTPRTWQQSTAEYIQFLKENEKELRI